MARPRVYRHDVRCSECGSNRVPKDGAPKGRQVYHCGDCGRRAIPDAAYQHPSAADKECALAMYQEGSSLSAIARIFGVSVPEAKLYRTDAYRVYDWLPADRHQVGKGGAVNWDEGLHSRCRGKMNRLHRRTKGYTKGVAMLGVFAGLAAVGLAREILRQSMLRIPCPPAPR